MAARLALEVADLAVGDGRLRPHERHPPPLVAGRRIKLRYATQVKSRPPTFAVFGSRVAELPGSYQGYLVNALREDFDLWGTPIRLLLRAGQNPYSKKK